MTHCKIVILDQDQHRRDYLRWMMTDLGYVPFTFEKETICLDNLSHLEPEMVISGSLTKDRAYRFINTIKMIDHRLPVLMISGDRSIQGFINSNGFGNVKVIPDGFQLSKIKRIITRILNNRSADRLAVSPDSPLIVGNSPEISGIKERISELGPLKETILIWGEPGTGKELVARAIHAQSDRCNRPLVKVDLALLTPDMLDEVFFAIHQDNLQPVQQNQIFETAQGGTLFLKEIGAIPVSHQGLLIGFFENDDSSNSGRARQDHTTHDIRLVISSSHDPDQLVMQGKLRKDLYFRLNAVTVEIPPLRDRVDDISLLTDFFMDEYCIELGRVHYEFSQNTKEAFGRYHWPGNVKELKRLVRTTVISNNENSIFENLPIRFEKNWAQVLPDQMEDIYKLAGLDDLKKKLKNLDNLSLKSLCRKYTARTEKKIIQKALEHTGWNRKKASSLLNISYKSLLTKIKLYRLR